MDSVDRKLLNLLQASLPLEERPFLNLGERLLLSEKEVIERTENLKKEGVIREISAIFDTKKLGYQSALVGMKVKPELLDGAGEIISKHPGVSHNYARKHDYNLWFTIGLPPEVSMEETVNGLKDSAGADDVLLLPAIRIFKIGVRLNMTLTDTPNLSFEKLAKESKEEESETSLSEAEINLIKVLQENFPIEEKPFKSIARRLKMNEKEVISMVRAFKEKKVMRRLSAVLFHRKAGFTSNFMVAWEVPEEKVAEAGKKMAAFHAVSHCYERKTYDRWPYNLYTMIHGRSKTECEVIIGNLSREAGVKKYLVLPSDKEYKKVRLKYFYEMPGT